VSSSVAMSNRFASLQDDEEAPVVSKAQAPAAKAAAENRVPKESAKETPRPAAQREPSFYTKLFSAPMLHSSIVPNAEGKDGQRPARTGRIPHLCCSMTFSDSAHFQLLTCLRAHPSLPRRRRGPEGAPWPTWRQRQERQPRHPPPQARVRAPQRHWPRPREFSPGWRCLQCRCPLPAEGE
jgi:hypothetical protein